MNAKVKMIYRPSHYQMPIIAVIEELNLFDRFGLDVQLGLVDSTEKAESLLVDGEVDVVIGNHVTPMSDRVKGVPIVYFAQANNWTQEKMITSVDEINVLRDLKGKKFGIRTPLDRHPSITSRLHLTLAGLDLDRDLEIVPVTGNNHRQIESVKNGTVEATIIGRPYDLMAQKQGLKVVEIPQIPMVCGLTITALSPYARENGDIIKACIKALMNGISYFKKNKTSVLPILKSRLSERMGLQDDDLYEYMHSSLVDNLEDKLYPTLEAIQNVYRLALWVHPEVKDLNPLVMWDTHFVRELDEEGFEP